MSVSSANTLLLNDLVDGVFRNSAKLNPKELKKWKDFAVKTTKSTQFARVNQFEVDATLLGLIEKFQVLNRDDLAQGLDEKLKQLSAISSKWTPEVLALLLHLSDQPSKKTNVYSPQERPSTPQQEPLTWNQILSEDPVSDEDLWLQESYSPISSDSEDEIPLSPKLQPIAPLTPIEGPELSQDFGKILIESNDDFLQDLTETQFWRKALVDKQGSSTDNEALISVPELHVIREAIIMLRGVPTSLFHIDQNGVVHFIEKYTLNEITQSLFSSVMQKLATIGTRIGAIRSWADKPQSDHSMQRFQAIICNRLTNFYKLLSDLEILYTDTSREKVVSLLELGDMLSKFARPLIQLEIVITHLTGANTSPFLHLELLYDLTCMHQASGDDTLYEYMAKIFFDALTIYLRTIRHWMQQGKLETNDSTFFIARTQGNSDDSSIWHDQYYLLKSSNAALHAPKFTHPAAGRILNAGKTVIFLERLGVKAPEYIIDDDDLKFDNLSGQDWNTNLAPFATLFEKSFNAWIQTKYSPASSILRQQLTTTYALERNLAALQEIYFSSDGSMFQSFADPIFEAIDRRASSWNDKFLLSGRLQELYRTSSTVEVERLSIRTTSSRASTRSVKALSTIIIDYNLSWPLLNVIRKSSLIVYQKVLKLILQIYRVKYLLRDLVLMRGQEHFNHVEISIRHDLQCFVDTLFAHTLNTILKPACQHMGLKMSFAEDIDQMTEVHEFFIQTIQTQCLLTKNLTPIYHAIICVLELGVRFADLRRQLVSKSGSTVDNGKKKRSKARRRSTMRQGRQLETDNSLSSGDSSDNDKDPDYDADTEKLSGNEGSYAERLQKMKEEMARLRSFVVTGLRGISRAGGEPTWEMLAEQLDWGVGATT